MVVYLIKRNKNMRIETLHNHDFLKVICFDFGISQEKEYTLRLPTDKKTFKQWTRGWAHGARIFDGSKEHPYMIDRNTRNEKQLETATELRYLGFKTFSQIVKESGVKLQREKCRICEGGGWHSEGTKYTYKNISCEF
jgi:hypothetical protein